MSIAQLSGSLPAWFNRGGNAVSDRAAAQRQSNPSADAPGQTAKSDAPARRNPLVAAMMEALQSLMPASPAAVPPAAPVTAATPASPASPASTSATLNGQAPTATVAPTDAPATTSTPSGAPVDLKQVAYAFAHELYSALRSADSGDDSATPRGGRPDNPGSNGHHGHHGHHGVLKSAYGDLAQSLEALAQTLGTATTAPAPAPVPAPAPGPMPGPIPAAGGATVGSATSPPAAPVVPQTPPAATVGPTTTTSASALPAGSPTTTTAAVAPADSPLLSAFKSLLSALAPSTAPGTSGTDTSVEKLAAFLHQMAQSLGLSSSGSASSVPASGSLLNVTA